MTFLFINNFHITWGKEPIFNTIKIKYMMSYRTACSALQKDSSTYSEIYADQMNSGTSLTSSIVSAVYDTEPKCNFLNIISFCVSVPVLSESRYSIRPTESE